MADLPEPICRVRGMLGNIMTVYVKGYERRKGDGLYSAEQMQSAIKAEREACLQAILGELDNEIDSCIYDSGIQSAADAIRARLDA